ncbi:DUF6884 domain-containing protein [Micromonospora sp. NPDC049101]|uniref:DUF6884 domain-containing protein n=1 Tax=Micromonospora sp. NPDC049101 TaxID=3155032 RepID=UPI0033F6E467
MTDQPAWQLILTAARQLTKDKIDFSRAELIDEVQRLHPTRHPQSLGPVIQGMTRDTTGGPPSPCGTPLIRVGRGRYTLADSGPSHTPAPQPVIPAQRPSGQSRPAEPGEIPADIALIGCVKTKLDHPVSARDLYVSPLFIRRRAYGERHARRYYILSAEHGLVLPETVLAPYDTALADQSKDYRRAWGQWVAAKLMRAESQVRDRVVEIHAGDEYAQAIAPLLTQAGATVRRPLAGLPLGEQLAWYDRQPQPPASEQPVALAKQSRETIRRLAPTGIPVPVQPGARAIVAALLKYGREHQAERAGTSPRFTPHPEANTLILTDPFAFLLAVIFDQGIPAERAWKAPYDLHQRLGHLDAARMASEPEQVRAAVAQPRTLHRFVNNMPGWLVAAAIIVVNEYGGDAGRIWADKPRATDLATRLRRFPGIAQKKSAMAVEILARDLAVPIRELSGTDIAYDVHVRRVFLRTRLAERDDLDHMVEVARWLHPERPGELDFPAWLIGRRWCGPGTPNCGACPLRSICPKDIAQAAAV